jgi:hypothetical protein
MYNLDKYLSSQGFGPYISFGQCRITATVADASKEASMEPVRYVSGSWTVQAEERIKLDRWFKILLAFRVTLFRLVNSYLCCAFETSLILFLDCLTLAMMAVDPPKCW